MLRPVGRCKLDYRHYDRGAPGLIGEDQRRLLVCVVHPRVSVVAGERVREVIGVICSAHSEIIERARLLKLRGLSPVRAAR